MIMFLILKVLFLKIVVLLLYIHLFFILHLQFSLHCIFLPITFILENIKFRDGGTHLLKVKDKWLYILI